MSTIQITFMAFALAVVAVTSDFGTDSALAGLESGGSRAIESSASAPPQADLVADGPGSPDPDATVDPDSGTPDPNSTALDAGTDPAPGDTAVRTSWADGIGNVGTAFLGVSTPTGSAEEVTTFAEAAGRVPDVVMLSRDWASGGFDLEAVNRLWTAGHIPMIAWEPWDHTGRGGGRLRSRQPDYQLQTIINGDHDEFILDWASSAAAWGHPVILRFAHEMNGYWYPWAELANANAEGEFIEAWRHVYDLFIEAQATNVIWVWSPNLAGVTFTPIDQLWPGDEYVDWVGLVGYLGNGIDPRVWTPTFDELFGPTLAEVRALTDHPIVITEIGATELGGRKAEWITGVLEAVNSRPDIVGLVWFEINKESDWRITTSKASAEAFAAGIADESIWGFTPSALESSLAPLLG